MNKVQWAVERNNGERLNFKADDVDISTGYLVLHTGGDTVAIFAPGEWRSAVRVVSSGE